MAGRCGRSEGTASGCQANTTSDEEQVCWICFQEGSVAAPLVSPCSCPRSAHGECLAKWQITNAGRSEENRCRFCQRVLPTWRGALGAEMPPALPVMSIHCKGKTYWLQVLPGPEGLELFKADVRQLLGLKESQSFDITFQCKMPGYGSSVELQGLDTFDAATYCASIAASERLRSQSSLGSEAGSPADLLPSSSSSGCGDSSVGWSSRDTSIAWSSRESSAGSSSRSGQYFYAPSEPGTSIAGGGLRARGAGGTGGSNVGALLRLCRDSLNSRRQQRSPPQQQQQQQQRQQEQLAQAPSSSSSSSSSTGLMYRLLKPVRSLSRPS